MKASPVGCVRLTCIKRTAFSSKHTNLMKNRQRHENYHGRPDWRTRAVVDAGIELGNRYGIEAAATFLNSQSVPLSMALRVLTLVRQTSPDRRASYRPSPS